MVLKNIKFFRYRPFLAKLQIWRLVTSHMTKLCTIVHFDVSNNCANCPPGQVGLSQRTLTQEVPKNWGK